MSDCNPRASAALGARTCDSENDHLAGWCYLVAGTDLDTGSGCLCLTLTNSSVERLV